jgi:hypothetical protein
MASDRMAARDHSAAHRHWRSHRCRPRDGAGPAVRALRSALRQAGPRSRWLGSAHRSSAAALRPASRPAIKVVHAQRRTRMSKELRSQRKDVLRGTPTNSWPPSNLIPAGLCHVTGPRFIPVNTLTRNAYSASTSSAFGRPEGKHPRRPWWATRAYNRPSTDRARRALGGVRSSYSLQ